MILVHVIEFYLLLFLTKIMPDIFVVKVTLVLDNFKYQFQTSIHQEVLVSGCNNWKSLSL